MGDDKPLKGSYKQSIESQTPSGIHQTNWVVIKEGSNVSWFYIQFPDLLKVDEQLGKLPWGFWRGTAAMD